MTAYVYILASYKKGTLYIGVTNDLVRRINEHREGVTGALPNAIASNYWSITKRSRTSAMQSSARKT